MNMASEQHHEQTYVAPYEPSTTIKTLSFAFIAIGVIGLIVGFIRNPQQLWTSYLTAFFYVSCLGIGGLFFTSIQHIANAGWSAGIRRFSESMTSFLPVTLIGSLVLILGLKFLYPWADADFMANNPLVQSKAGYLNTPFLIARLLIFGIGMLVFAKLIVGNSLKQDKTGDETLTKKNLKYSVIFILFFSLSFTLFSMDLLMSLLPTWYSTIFGVYCFAGLFQSSLAFLMLMMIYFRKNGIVKGYYTEEHMHDVGKYLFGFTIFWAYIAFSQFMLIWYANIPEETEYYLMRSQGGWMGISMALLIFKFIVPFLALLPKAAKRNHNHLIAVCFLILVMQYVDVYWMVYPNFFHNHVNFGFYEIAMLLLFVGIFLQTIMKFFQKNSLVAVKDPRMHESLNHHVTY